MALGPDKVLLAGFGNSALSAGNSFSSPFARAKTSHRQPACRFPAVRTLALAIKRSPMAGRR